MVVPNVLKTYNTLEVSSRNSLTQIKEANPNIRFEKVAPIKSMGLIINNNEEAFSNDIFSAYQWALKIDGQTVIRDIDDIRSETITPVEGMDLSLGRLHKGLPKIVRNEVIVAIIDSGVALDHPELKEKIALNEDECDKGRIPFEPQEDKDENGFIGDCKGWDFTGEGSNRPYDDLGHGTHVAGIVAAKSNNSEGIAGIAPNVKILPLKVMGKGASGKTSGSGGFTDKVAKAILNAVQRGAQIINLSLGWPVAMDTQYLREAFKVAKEKGVLIVAAAGNNSSFRPIFPCAYRSVICVGSTSINGALAGFSNKGAHVDFLAPGEEILSTTPRKLEPQFFSTIGYDLKNGTSQSAPMLAAAMALIKGKNPSLNPDQIIAKIGATSKRPLIVGEAQNGLIHIPKALFIKDPVYVRPILKERDTIHLDEKGHFEFTLPIKNYGREVKQLEIEIESSALNIKNDKFLLQKLDSGEVREMLIRGFVNNRNLESKQVIKIKLIYPNEVDLKGNKTIIELARQVFITQGLKSAKSSLFRGKNRENLAKKVNGRWVAKLRTVSDPFKESVSPIFYATYAKHNNTEENERTYSTTLNIYTQNKNSFQEHEAIFKDTQKIISIQQLDLNKNGQLDLLLRVIENKEGAQSIQYIYLDSRLNPLFPKYKFKFLPKSAVLNVSDFKLAYKKTGQGIMGHPLFVDKGTIPQADRNPAPWAEENLGNLSHIYSISPNPETAEMETHIVDNYQFVEKLTEEYGLGWDENISIHHSIGNQSIPHFLVSIGAIFSPRVFLLKWELSAAIMTSLEGGLPFINDSQKNMVLGSSDFTAISLSQSSSRVAQSFIDLNKHTITHREIEVERGQDHILGSLPAFKKGNTFYSIYQTKTKLVFETSKARDDYPIDRVSFVNGQIFNQVFIPLDLERPSLYIDATQLNSSHVFLLGISNENKWSAPIKHSFSIPENCMPLNPGKIDAQMSLQFLCHEKNDFYLKSVGL